MGDEVHQVSAALAALLQHAVGGEDLHPAQVEYSSNPAEIDPNPNAFRFGQHPHVRSAMLALVAFYGLSKFQMMID